MHSVYSIAPADWAVYRMRDISCHQLEALYQRLLTYWPLLIYQDCYPFIKTQNHTLKNAHWKYFGTQYAGFILSNLLCRPCTVWLSPFLILLRDSNRKLYSIYEVNKNIFFLFFYWKNYFMLNPFRCNYVIWNGINYDKSSCYFASICNWSLHFMSQQWKRIDRSFQINILYKKQKQVCFFFCFIRPPPLFIHSRSFISMRLCE